MISLVIAAAGALVAQSSAATNLTCKLDLANGSHFRVNGYFDKDSLHSNLSDLIRADGTFVPLPYDFLIINDGSDNYRWRLARPGQKFDALLTRYGSGIAVLTVEGQKLVGGRHWGRHFVGVGFCDVPRAEAGK